MPKKAQQRPRIAVVDHERRFLDAVKSWLMCRYDVFCLCSGDELLTQLDKIEPDMVILDAHVSGLKTGAKVCQTLRSKNRYASLPVLFLTSPADDADFLRNLEAQGDPYLNKPVNGQQLHNQIQEVLGTSLPVM